MDKKAVAKKVLEKVGGEKNVKHVQHCATRLRFNLKDVKKADQKALEDMPEVVTVIYKGGQYQVVIGNEVASVYRELTQLADFDQAEDIAEEDTDKNVISRVLDTVAGIFVPIIPALAGGGMIKALLAVLSAFGLVTATSTTYQFLNFFGDAPFYFLPVIIAASAAKKFNTNQFVALTMGAILVHPTFNQMIAGARESGEALSLFGLPVTLTNYPSSVIPIILSIWFMSYVEPRVDKVLPGAIKTIFRPLLTLLIVAVVTVVAIGPIGAVLADGLNTAVNFLDMRVSWLVPTLVGAFTPLLVMAGMHYGLIPIGINNLATIGYDTVAGPGMLVSNIAQGGAALGFSLRTKDKKAKQLATSTGITAIFGITEPVLYGINLRYKKPLIAAIIGGGVAGLFLGIFKVGRYAQVPPSILALPSFIGGDGFRNLILASISVVIAFVVSFIVAYFLGLTEDDKQKEAKTNKPNSDHKEVAVDYANVKSAFTVYAPMTGKTLDLSDVSDPAFSGGALGKGLAIQPEDGRVYAPIDGEVSALFESHHAVGLTSTDGLELLIHVGMDTVQLDGQHFLAHIEKGDKISKGDLLLSCDLEAIKAAGYDIVTPVVVTNASDYTEVIAAVNQEVTHGDVVMKIAK